MVKLVISYYALLSLMGSTEVLFREPFSLREILRKS